MKCRMISVDGLSKVPDDAFGLIDNEDSYLAYWLEDGAVLMRDTQTHERWRADERLLDYMIDRRRNKFLRNWDALVLAIQKLPNADLLQLEEVLQTEFARRDLDEPCVDEQFKREWLRKRMDEHYTRIDFEAEKHSR